MVLLKEKSINFYFIMVPLKEKGIKVWYSKAQNLKATEQKRAMLHKSMPQTVPGFLPRSLN